MRRLVCLGLFLLAGCGGAEPTLSSKQDSGEVPAGKEASKKSERAPETPQPRKIIYTARLDLIVEDFDDAEPQLRALLKKHKGYIARVMVHGKPGARRWGEWKLRVPVAAFEEFLSEAAALGELRERTRDSEDITDAYYDTAAEAKNLEAREVALRKLYQEKIVAELADLLAVDRELNAVRTQINIRKGRLARWDKETAYTTITLVMQERRAYDPEESPTFGTRIGRTFESSIRGLKETAKTSVLVLVALAPWSPLLVVAFLLLRWLHLRRRKRINPPISSPKEDIPA